MRVSRDSAQGLIRYNLDTDRAASSLGFADYNWCARRLVDAQRARASGPGVRPESTQITTPNCQRIRAPQNLHHSEFKTTRSTRSPGNGELARDVSFCTTDGG